MRAGGAHRKPLSRSGRVLLRAATIGIVAGVTGLASLLGTTGFAQADTVKTMRFTGSLDLLGLLKSVNVSPTSLSIPAGGAVEFVNATGKSGTLRVDGQSYSLGSGQSKVVRFPGGSSSSSERATLVGLPLLSGVTAPSGTVGVGAQPPDEPDNPPPPPGGGDPGNPGGGDPGTPGGGTPGNPGGGGDNGGTPGNPGGGVPALPDGYGDLPSAGGDVGDGGLPAGSALPENEPGNGTALPPADGAVDNPALAKPGGPAGFTIASILPGPNMTLLILVATVLLGGVGSALIRTVAGYRRSPAAG
jgi:hypothetical protein